MAVAGRNVVWFGADAPRNGSEYGLVDVSESTSLRCGDFELLRADELPVAGLHNAVNALAAVALCRAIGLPTGPLVAALKSFKGLPHRVEFVAEIDGVTYYDDSKGTNVGATEAALKGMTQPVVLIAGGDGKGQDFRPLLPACERVCRAVVLIGRDAPILAQVLNDASSPYIAIGDDEDDDDEASCRCCKCRRWKWPSISPPTWRNRATPCCCRRPAPAWICSATTSTAPTCLSPRSKRVPEHRRETHFLPGPQARSTQHGVL